MRKEYVVYVDRYDYFDSFCSRRYHESGYETLGSNPIEALKAYRNLKSHDYDHGDSYQRTRNIQVIWVADKPTNNHNFFTKENDRLIKIPVIGFDGSIIDYVTTTKNELKEYKKTLWDHGWEYDSSNNCIKTLNLSLIQFINYDDSDFTAFDNEDFDDLPF
jgi:hypothetical protein